MESSIWLVLLTGIPLAALVGWLLAHQRAQQNITHLRETNARLNSQLEAQQAAMEEKSRSFEAARPSEAGSTVATGEGANALYIVRVNAYTPGDYEALSASEQLELRRNLAQAQAGEELTAYLEQLRSTAQVSVFEQTLQ